jgi:hypothetical protein
MDFKAPEVAKHLLHLPDTCGRCGNDHRLAIVQNTTDDLEVEYGQIMCKILKQGPDASPENLAAGKYWQALYEAELTERYRRQRAGEIDITGSIEVTSLRDLLSKMGVNPDDDGVSIIEFTDHD